MVSSRVIVVSHPDLAQILIVVLGTRPDFGKEGPSLPFLVFPTRFIWKVLTTSKVFGVVNVGVCCDRAIVTRMVRSKVSGPVVMREGAAHN